MYRGPSLLFKVARSDEDEYAVWHADAWLPAGWREAEFWGSAAACWELVEAAEGERGYLFIGL
ncbi:MAG: MbtH family NRPS accessory protein [Candidatus Promineifilaceae bacterium]